MNINPSLRPSRLAPVVALLALGLAVGGCTKSSSKKPKGIGTAIATGPARNLQLSPDGKTLAVLLDVNPPAEKNAPDGVMQGVLTTVPAEGGKPRQLGGGVTSLEDGYRITEDGKWIAYLQGFQFKTQSGSLNVAPMPQGEARLLAHDVKFYRFSGNSKHLGYVAQGEMHLIDLAGGEDRVVAKPVATFEFSKDGAALLMRRPFNAGGELLLAKVGAAGEVRKLGENVGEYGFSPDGATVAFTARVGGEGKPYSLFSGPASGNVSRLAEEVSVFSFSPDSKWITFVDGVGVNKPYGNLQVAAVGGGAPAKVGEDVVEHRWAPDSQAIALRESHEDKAGKVWTTFKVVTLPGLKTRLKEDGVANGFINFLWSSDGRHLAYLRHVSGTVNLQLLDVASDAAPRVVDQWVFSYQFAPGDRALWYRSNCVRNGRECELLEASVDDATGKPKRIAAGIANFRQSPDGEKLLLMYPRLDTENATDLGWMDLKAAQAAQSTKGVDQYTVSSPVFLDKAGAKLAYIVGERKREGVYVADLK